MNRKKKSTLDLTVDTGGRESELLGESARQMNSAINEAFAEIGVLSQLISTMKKNARRLKRTTQELKDNSLSESQVNAFSSCSDEMIECAGKSQDRMQFADRMHHQLYDVQNNLRRLAELSKAREKQSESKGGSWTAMFGASKSSKANKSMQDELHISTDHSYRR